MRRAGLGSLGARAHPVPRRARLALEIVRRYAAVRAALRSSELEAVLARHRRCGGSPARPARVDHQEALRLGRAVTRVLQILPTDSRCLVRSITLDSMLSRRGLESVLVIGVDPGTEFAAHAWIEHGGVPVLPDGGGEFARLAEL